MKLSDDVGASELMRRLGVSPQDLLGSGGEAWVLALGADRVVRIGKPGTQPSKIEKRSRLLRELARTADRVPYALPRVLDEVTHGDRSATIEIRLPGAPLTDELSAASGEARRELISAYLDAAAAFGDLDLPRDYFGEVMGEVGKREALRSKSYRGYLEASARRSLCVAGEDFADVDPAEIARALPECAEASPVHLDAFAGNMLAQDGRVTAVLDFGTISIIGDRRLDPLTAAAYLAPEITPGASSEDWDSAQRWLAAHELDEFFPAAHRWLACFWSGAIDAPRLQAWSRRVLGIPSLS